MKFVMEVAKAGWEFGLWLISELFKASKGIGNFLVQNFPYDKPSSAIAVFAILMIMTLSLMTLLIAGGGVIYFGSGVVSKNTGESGAGEVVKDRGQDLSGGQTIPTSGATSTTVTIPVTTTGYCGNDACDDFLTSAKVLDTMFSNTLPGCESPYVVYDVPGYCASSSTLEALEYDGKLYSNAMCILDWRKKLSAKCYLTDQKVYYTETKANCPEDCGVEGECTVDLSCASDADCRRITINDETEADVYCSDDCAAWSSACKQFTFIKHDLETGLYLYHCVFYEYPTCMSSGPFGGHCCSGQESDAGCQEGYLVLGSTYSLAELKAVPWHCPCTSDSGCGRDFGGTKCCSGGTIHEGFCYFDAAYCDQA